MAQIDSSIYGQQQLPDLMGNLQKGMSMRDMLNEKKKRQAIDQAYQAGVVKNEDGTTTYDAGKAMSAIGLVDGAGKEAYELSVQQQQQQANALKLKQEKMLKDADLVAKIAPEIKDQGSYEAGLMHLGKMGVDISQMPKAYDPGLVNRYGAMALSAKDKWAQQNDDRNFKLKEKELALKKDELAKKDGKASGALEGRKALDKDYAKDYNDWTTNSRNAANKNLERLKEARQALKEDPSLTGPIAGSTPDFIRNYTNEKAILTRDKVRAAAQGALKATLGSAFTEKEGERIMNQSYNEKLSPEANLDLIDKAINEIEGNMANADLKASYFQKNGSLNGLDVLGDSSQSQVAASPKGSPRNQSSSGMVQVMAPNGKVIKVPESRLQEVLNGGAKEIPMKAGF